MEKKYTDARYPEKINDLIDNDGNVNEEILGPAVADKADLVNGKVPADQLPSYVDDVAEYASLADFPEQGEAGKIYVALDTGFTYRWGGSAYVQIGGQDLSEFYTKDEADELLDEKQDVIEDLADIRAGAEAGATAVQDSDLEEAIEAYHDSSKQDKLPDTTSTDEGKVLMVDNNGDLIFDNIDALPDATSASAGQVLGLDNNKEAVWMTPEAGLDASQFFAEFDATQTYAIGNKVSYNGKFYLCKTVISTAGDWDSTKWVETKPVMQYLNLQDYSAGTLTVDEFALVASSLCVIRSHSSYFYLESYSPTYLTYRSVKPLFVGGTNFTGLLSPYILIKRETRKYEYKEQEVIGIPGYKIKTPLKIGDETYPLLQATILAPAYSASATYAVGDLVTYNNQLYKCTTAITVAEAWTAAHWTATSVANAVIGAINTAH